MSALKDYVGDGCYVDFDGFGIILTTENGIATTNMIYLEPDALAALNRYAERIKSMSAEELAEKLK